MARLTLLLCAVFLAAFVEAKPSLSRERRGLRDILNSKVIYAEFVARKSRKGKGFDHYGVVVTNDKGERWLVHKGFRFSRLSHTVVTSAKHMSSRWKLLEKVKVYGVAKVTDYIQAGGKYFHPHFDNAFHAANRMMKIGKKPSKKFPKS